jgi:hypothetical protein
VTQRGPPNVAAAAAALSSLVAEEREKRSGGKKKPDRFVHRWHRGHTNHSSLDIASPLLTMSLSAGDFAVALTEKDSERLTLRNELNKLEVGEALQA